MKDQTEVKLIINGDKLECAWIEKMGKWEIHPEPVESSAWGYADSLDEIVERGQAFQAERRNKMLPPDEYTERTLPLRDEELKAEFIRRNKTLIVGEKK